MPAKKRSFEQEFRKREQRDVDLQYDWLLELPNKRMKLWNEKDWENRIKDRRFGFISKDPPLHPKAKIKADRLGTCPRIYKEHTQLMPRHVFIPTAGLPDLSPRVSRIRAGTYPRNPLPEPDWPKDVDESCSSSSEQPSSGFATTQLIPSGSVTPTTFVPSAPSTPPELGSPRVSSPDSDATLAPSPVSLHHDHIEPKAATDEARRCSGNVQEETFQNRPSIKLIIPTEMKAMLVDDWENVTKHNQLVPLPHAHSFDEIISDYLAWETPNRPEDSPEKDLLEETMAGLREYFNKALGRILLYKWERVQYIEFREQWELNPDGEHKCAADTYGAEHLLRLIVSLPELVAQTNMDQQSVNRLRDEISKFTYWLKNNRVKYFVNEYVAPGHDYAEKSRNG